MTNQPANPSPAPEVLTKIKRDLGALVPRIVAAVKRRRQARHKYRSGAVVTPDEALATEREMHNAWRKRAEEAEQREAAALTALAAATREAETLRAELKGARLLFWAVIHERGGTLIVPDRAILDVPPNAELQQEVDWEIQGTRWTAALAPRSPEGEGTDASGPHTVGHP